MRTELEKIARDEIERRLNLYDEVKAENERYRSALSAVVNGNSFRTARMIAQDALRTKDD